MKRQKKRLEEKCPTLVQGLFADLCETRALVYCVPSKEVWLHAALKLQPVETPYLSPVTSELKAQRSGDLFGARLSAQRSLNDECKGTRWGFCVSAGLVKSQQDKHYSAWH